MRAIYEPISVYGLAPKEVEINIVIGTTFLKHMLKDSIRLLDIFSSGLKEKGFKVNIHKMPLFLIDFNRDSHNNKIVQNTFSSLVISSVYSAKLFHHAVDDSLSRGLDGNFSQERYFTDELYTESLLYQRRNYSYLIGDYYLKLIKKISPDLSVI